MPLFNHSISNQLLALDQAIAASPGSRPIVLQVNCALSWSTSLNWFCLWKNNSFNFDWMWKSTKRCAVVQRKYVYLFGTCKASWSFFVKDTLWLMSSLLVLTPPITIAFWYFFLHNKPYQFKRFVPINFFHKRILSSGDNMQWAYKYFIARAVRDSWPYRRFPFHSCYYYFFRRRRRRAINKGYKIYPLVVTVGLSGVSWWRFKEKYSQCWQKWSGIIS